MKTQLTAEQSANLISKGVSKDRASEIEEYNDPVSQWTHRGQPIYTLTDLLEILPKEIVVDACLCGLSIWQHRARYWITSYIQYSGREIAMQPIAKTAEELIDALYELALWLADEDVKKGAVGFAPYDS